jgi:hypothetical protein
MIAVKAFAMARLRVSALPRPERDLATLQRSFGRARTLT